MDNVLVSGYIGFNNFGDEAIFCALSKHLKKLGYNVSVLCNNPAEVSKKYDVQGFYFKSLKNVFLSILKCDILISGGGSLLQNKTSNFSLFYYLFILFLARILNKKVIIFSQGIEKIQGKFPSFLTKTILKTIKFISVRDEKSQQYLKTWNIESILTSDPAFSLVDDVEINKNKKDILVQLRDFSLIDKSFVKDLAFILSKLDENIKVFSFQEEYDKQICLEFIEELKKLGKNSEFIENKSIDETIEILNNSKFVLSTRLHGLIIAYALECETFAFVYDDKIKTLAQELEINNVDIRKYDSAILKDEIKNFLLNNKKDKKPYRRFDWSVLDNFLKI